MEQEIEELIEKFDNYMDKKGLSIQDKHNLTKLMSEDYWEDIKNEGESEPEPEEEDDLDDLDEEPKEEIEEIKPDKIKVVNKKVAVKPKKPSINKPVIEEEDDF